MNQVLNLITYSLVKKFIAHPSFVLTHVCYEELRKKDFVSPQHYGVSYDSEAVLAVNEANVTVGFIAFEEHKWNSSIEIGLAYVKPYLRGNGLHTKMFEFLTTEARKREASHITTSVASNNVDAIKAMQRQGRELTSHTFKYWLMKWDKVE